MSSSPDRRSSAARASRVQARARNCPGHQRQIAPQSQHPAARSSSPASSRTRPRSSSAPTSRSVFHFTEGQRGPPAAADRRAPAPQRGRGHQALVQDRDTNPAAVAEATPERKAAIEQVAGLGLTGHTCALVQVSRPAAGRSATPPSTSARRRRVEPPADAVDRCRDARRRRGQAVTERALRDLRAAQAVEHRHLSRRSSAMRCPWTRCGSATSKARARSGSTPRRRRLHPAHPARRSGPVDRSVAGVLVGQVQQAHRLLDMLEPV